jgi:hypothetical protein
MRIFNGKTFYISGGLAILLIFVSSVLLISRNIVTLDILGMSSNDCVPYNVFVRKGEKNYSVNISWSTKEECVGFVQYGRGRDNLDMVGIDIVNTRKSTEHSVNLEQLLTTETYYFLINSQEQAYGSNGVPLEFVLEEL